MAGVSDKQLHLVRHGEVHNPDRVLYGRLPGFFLSALGQKMAESAALELASRDRAIGRLIASPLERTRESAGPIAQAMGRDIEIDERIIEPTNWFEGKVASGPNSALKNPRYWYRMWNPFRPSWGEPFRSIASRMREAIDDAWDSTPAGDIVMVSHQAPIWITHRSVAGKPLAHNPAARRCELSSITSFERRGGRWYEVEYRTPAQGLVGDAIDVGAV